MHKEESLSALRLYLKEMTATWLRSALLALDVLGLIALMLYEVAERVQPEFSEALVIEIGVGLVLIGSFGTGNYIAFARILEQKIALDDKLRRSGPRIVPAGLRTEPGSHPEPLLTVRNLAEEDAINARVYLRWDDYTFLCVASSICSGEEVIWNLEDCSTRGRNKTLRAKHLSEKLGQAKEPMVEQAGSQVSERECWLFIECSDVQQSIYQTVGSYDGETWETHYVGLATV